MFIGHQTTLRDAGHADFLVEGLAQVFIVGGSIQCVLVLGLGFELD